MSFGKPKTPRLPPVRAAASPPPRPASPEVRAAAADARERQRLRFGRSSSRQTSPGVLSPLTVSNAALSDTLG